MSLDATLTLEQIREMFDFYDKDKGGTICSNELQQLCEDLGVKLGTVELTAAMRELDCDGSGEIEFEEFYRWFSSSKNIAEKLAAAKAEAAKTATQLFKQYDTDNSGFIERKEWLQIWKALFSDGGTLSKAHLKLARIELERADTDGDGRVSFNEFIEWMRALGMYA